MKFKKQGLTYLLVCSLVLSSSAFSADTSTTTTAHNINHHHYKDYKDYKDVPQKNPGHFEVIGAIGGAQLNAGNNSQIGVTSSESDTLHQTNSNAWDALASQLGIGYVYYFRDAQPFSRNLQWFPSIEPEVNVYNLSSNSIQGDVWRFNNPNFNELSYDIPIHSTRLMFDAALTVASWKRLAVYGIAGIGNAWTRAGYTDSDKGISCANQTLNLGTNTNSNFAWEAGAGLTFAVNSRIGVSLEYLYTNLGTVSTNGSGSSGTITAPVLSSARFKLSSRSGLLGLHIAL